MKPRSIGSRSAASAFTLVELLVVIGIIALLLSILLPTISSARKSGSRLKCMAGLREIGNALRLYANDNRGYYPVAQLTPASGYTYDIDGVPYGGTTGNAYWHAFISKYVTRIKTGLAVSDAEAAAQARRTLVWGCPDWDGYTNGDALGGGTNRLQTGYGMTLWPTVAPNYPSLVAGFRQPILDFPSANNNKERNWITSWGVASSQQGSFMKATVFGKLGSQKAILTDSRYWAVESNRPPATGPYPKAVVAQPVVTYSGAAGGAEGVSTYNGTGQTMVDLYRHGQRPRVLPGLLQYDPKGGKVSFNALFGDGHVATSADGKDAYLWLRMRFPN